LPHKYNVSLYHTTFSLSLSLSHITFFKGSDCSLTFDLIVNVY
jgi:hypothetical protein